MTLKERLKDIEIEILKRKTKDLQDRLYEQKFGANWKEHLDIINREYYGKIKEIKI